MKKNIIFNLFLFLLPIFLFGGTTGKISGKITDSNTGDPLVGVNVVLLDTDVGGASNLEGDYFILNIPPGQYTLRVTMIGYTSKEIINVIVNVDYTTKQNIELKSTVLEAEEAVIVVAKRPLIQMDATASAAVVSSDEIEGAPFESFTEIVQTKAGVTVDRDGDIHIRGGRSDEIGYYVDGVPNVNPFTNKVGAEVSTNAIEELSVITGSFSAEYGQALSGVINIVTKEGTKKYKGSFSSQIGNFWTDYSIDINDQVKEYANRKDRISLYEIEGSFGGPIPFFKNNLSFFSSIRSHEDKGYLYGIRKYTTTRTLLDSSEWKVHPMNPSDILSGQLKISARLLQGMKIQYIGLFDNKEWQSYSHSRKFVTDGNYNYFEKKTNHILKLTHQLSSKSFYTASFSQLSDNYQYYAYQDPYDPRYVWSGYQREDKNYEFYTGGTSNYRLTRDGTTQSVKIDFNSQISSVQEVKTGVEYKKHSLYQHDWVMLYDRIEPFTDENDNKIYDDGEPFVDLNSDGIWNQYDDNNDGIYGNIIAGEGLNNNKYHHYPKEFSFYIQDKIELTDIIINAGVRYDYFRPDGEIATDWTNPSKENTKPAKNKSQISPRFSIAYPITDRGRLFFSYGHFFQLPPYYRLYHNPDFEVKPGLIGSDIGNADLKPQKTVSYEVGVEQQVADNAAVYLKVYYRDIRNLLGQRIFNLPGGSDSYALFINRDFGNVKGVTFTFNQRFSSFFKTSIDYTYQVAQGNESDPTRTRTDFRLAVEPQKQVVFLDWDQTHALRINANLGVANKWGVKLIGRIESGYPYTPQAANELIRIAEENSGRKIPIYDFDLSMHKTFSVNLGKKSIYYSLYMKIYNLFDLKNENYVWDSTGRTGYVLAQYGGIVTPEWENRPHWYSKPRQVFLGISLNF